MDDSSASQTILAKIKEGKFLPKQRTNKNGIIPYQLHQIELDKILEKQGKYYPFLIKEKYKLDELISFRVPYYIGPMVDSHNSKISKENTSFAWMVRKNSNDTEAITPWNFSEKVNIDKSAENFIRRMTTKDTYLLAEDVLPRFSLEYQEFTVFNELSNLRVNNRPLSGAEKQEIFDTLFKKKKTVSERELKNWLRTKFQTSPSLSGMADKKFTSTYSTYIDLKKIFSDKVDDKKYHSDFEKIIEWSTIFEDKNIVKRKLNEISWLSEDEKKKVANLRYQGWGRLSHKLLTEIVDENGQNLLMALRNGTQNFNQIISSPDFKAKIEEANQAYVKDYDMEDILSEAYTSPQNKKAIRQVVKVVDDITRAMGGQKPAQIAIEFAREESNSSDLTKTRKSQLLKIYDNVADDIITSESKKDLVAQINDAKSLKDKLFLYFLQAGRDAYTGEAINVDRLNDYDIDHIMPQSFIVDDSLDNRVLVSRAVNNGKSDAVPVKLFGNNKAKGLDCTIRQMWKRWLDSGLITKKKFNNLVTDPEKISKYAAEGFINRQLVETSQVIKLVANILQAEYPSSEIIEVKAKYNSVLRKQFDLYKSRELNDYHHAIDAYLTTVVGNYLYQVYPRMRRYFVYGQFMKLKNNPDKDTKKEIHKFNFLYGLTTSEKDDICVSGTTNKVFSKSDIIHKLKRAYNFKYMNVVRKVEYETGKLFDETLYPRLDRLKENTKSYIPRAKNRPTDIYGGYSGKKYAHLAIAKIVTNKSVTYKVVGVPVRYLSTLQAEKDSEKYRRKVEELIAPSLKGKGVKEVKIIVGRVPKKQFIIDGNERFLLKSSVYRASKSQVVLSKTGIKTLADLVDDPKYQKHKYVDEGKSASQRLDNLFDEILNNVKTYNSFYKNGRNIEKLESQRNNFLSLGVSDKELAIKFILSSLKYSKKSKNCPKGLNLARFGIVQNNSGINLSENAILVYQSPTGLFERRVKISDL
ncbi:type II CRISPR RNA-guided endonuclease Cas9 [Lactobacillus corticis]|uniref:HNH Cas9-type domain-containing protein n=1 Tax=Lactobacillus corticis TaxID=2201249 RepID=A0A916QL39_9LACO|nr:type II CRISPR RNA-guided endonuclease Cas9 [Lactobacillus corticis]GFZ27775.1 hypothetical protein LCB40_16550 [Lactobacillus corticis]